MAQGLILGNRDRAILAVLQKTPLTAAQVRTFSVTLGEDAFRDERRVRERLQTLGDAGLVKTWPAAVTGGGLMHYYRLTPLGVRTIDPERTDAPARAVVSEIAPSRFHHAMATAEIMVHTLVAASAARVRVTQYHGDGEITLEAGEYRQQPDCHFQFESGGKTFNALFEIDNATEPLDSRREQSIRTKLLGYECYQDAVLQSWHSHGRSGPRPLFRVIFLTTGAERARHILWLARACAHNPQRRLCYATTQDAYLAEGQAVTAPVFNDHRGEWCSLVDLFPTSRFLREPIRLTPPLAPASIVR